MDNKYQHIFQKITVEIMKYMKIVGVHTDDETYEITTTFFDETIADGLNEICAGAGLCWSFEPDAHTLRYGHSTIHEKQITKDVARAKLVFRECVDE